ncbi:MAG: hypothetical protein GF355_10765 [Candidatus Eisenbacteria bacterium]|nr:hypothetical protein [Candidatus Eisenbacteria bacterium]
MARHQDHSPRRYRWSCDATVLRLGRELRALGFPVDSPDGTGDGSRTILLTRGARRVADRKLAGMPAMVLLKRDKLPGQLTALERLFRIGRAARPWSLCVRCGGALSSHAPATYQGRLPDYVVTQSGRIAECLRCGHLFWRATHTRSQEQRWRSLLPGIQSPGGGEPPPENPA